MIREDGDDPLGGESLPVFDVGGRLTGEKCRSGCHRQVFADGIKQAIGALGEGDGPLGVGAQGQAGDSEKGGFLLDASRIRNDQGGLGLEAEEIQVAEGFAEP